MTIGYPTNTVILIVATMIGGSILIWFSLSATLNQLAIAPNLKRTWRWGVAIVLAGWLLARLALSVNPPGGVAQGAPIITAFLVFGITVGTLPLLLSPVFRQIVRGIPETWLVGIQSIRLGFVFLALTDMKLLPPQFGIPAGYGDMAAGLLALGAVYLLVRRSPYSRVFVIGWNVLGLLDFVTAVATGITFIGAFAAQLAASGVSVLYLNYVFIIPSFAVPLFTVLHIYSLFQILSGSARAGATKQSSEASAPTSAFQGEPRSVNP